MMIPPIMRASGAAYRNPRLFVAESGWDRRRVLGQWLGLNRRDSAWIPPHLPQLRHLLMRQAYFRKSTVLLLAVEALPGGDALEVPVATALVRVLPARPDTAFLSLFYCVNDRDVFETVIDALYEELPALGIRQLLGSLALSPFLPGAVLHSHWQRLPAGLPYHPPYVPELFGSVMELQEQRHLFHLQDAPVGNETPNGLELKPLDWQQLAAHLDVLNVTHEPWLGELDTDELTVVSALLRPLRPLGFGAWLTGKLVGLLLLHWDTASALRLTAGASGLPGLLYPYLAQRAKRAQVVALGVIPEFRRRGIASALLNFAWQTLGPLGLVSLSVGPVPQGASATFLEAMGARPREAFGLYSLAF